MTARAAPGALLAVALVLPGTLAVAQQYFVYVGTYTSEPSSGAPPLVIPGRAASPPTLAKAFTPGVADIASAALPDCLV